MQGSTPRKITEFTNEQEREKSVTLCRKRTPSNSGSNDVARAHRRTWRGGTYATYATYGWSYVFHRERSWTIVVKVEGTRPVRAAGGSLIAGIKRLRLTGSVERMAMHVCAVWTQETVCQGGIPRS